MATKLSNAARGSYRGLTWLLVLTVALSISAYSLYFVARTLGVPKIFAAGFSTAYDGVALIAADKALQFAQEGKSGAFPRMVMIVFAGLSAFLNSLHAVFASENPLAIPMWAGLPLAAVAAFELHTSQARAKAQARMGITYPAPMPKWAGHQWATRFLHTLGQFRDVSSDRGDALARAHGWVPRKARKALARNTATVPAAAVTPARRPASAIIGSATPDDTTASATSRSATAAPHSNASGADTATDQPFAHGAEQSATPEDDTATNDDASDVTADVASPWPGSATGHVTGSASIECWHCHKKFVPLRKTARYCGSNCRTAACRARKAS